MRTKAKLIITGVAVGAYMLIRETVKLEKRHDELEIYENGVNDVIDKFNGGLDTDGDRVININFKNNG